jgi:hypothetical protein
LKEEEIKCYLSAGQIRWSIYELPRAPPILSTRSLLMWSIPALLPSSSINFCSSRYLFLVKRDLLTAQRITFFLEKYSILFFSPVPGTRTKDCSAPATCFGVVRTTIIWAAPTTLKSRGRRRAGQSELRTDDATLRRPAWLVGPTSIKQTRYPPKPRPHGRKPACLEPRPQACPVGQLGARVPG